jgi:hypothetical protein
MRQAKRHEDRAQALQVASLSRTPHRLGVALSSAVSSFAGTDGADGAASPSFPRCWKPIASPEICGLKSFFLSSQIKPGSGALPSSSITIRANFHRGTYSAQR